MRAPLALVFVASGCAKILGLDETTFTQDAMIGPPTCQGAPRCTSITGRSACGQLFQTGAEGGQPLRAAEPTGELCTSVADGPCAFAVSALPVADFFAGAGTPIAGAMDDCGRFVVPDIDPAIADVALSFAAPSGFAQSATLVFAREATVGLDENLEAFVVSEPTIQQWTTAMTASMEPDITSGYLVRYTASTQMPVEGEQVAKDASSPLMNEPGAIPWAAYFAASAPFGLLDPAQGATAAHGTAYANLGSGTFSLEGFRPGARCRVMGLQQIANTFIFVIAKNC
ncbi:MAG: hypothetical protein ACKV2T_30700 [Kofleriaceae bacterium]